MKIESNSNLQSSDVPPANVARFRREWLAGIQPSDIAYDYFNEGPEDLFCKRAAKVTGIRPDATEQQKADFANGILREALHFVRSVRDTVNRRPVTEDEVMSVHSKGTAEFQKWARPTYREAIKIVLEWQTPDGWDIR
jgi:hypothetical protein